jgi:3-deoxy-7-phosphoheptulonate synthase
MNGLDTVSCESPMTSTNPSFRLASRPSSPEGSVVRIGTRLIGGRETVVIAGPCAVESRDQLLQTARAVQKSGAAILRGGAFKPRSSPYSFQGLEEEGLKILAEARAETGLPVITEVMDTRQVALVCRYADILQVGSRNMQNFPLLKEVGMSGLPVMLKRGFSATIEEFLSAAEYILKQGNQQVMLCERGIRTFETAYRNTLDLNAVPVLKQLSHLPVIVDPSHGTGRRWMVQAMSRAAIAAGADGLMIEVHCCPETALCDGDQSLEPDQFAALMNDLARICTAMDRPLATLPQPELSTCC